MKAIEKCMDSKIETDRAPMTREAEAKKTIEAPACEDNSVVDRALPRSAKAWGKMPEYLMRGAAPSFFPDTAVVVDSPTPPQTESITHRGGYPLDER